MSILFLLRVYRCIIIFPGVIDEPPPTLYLGTLHPVIILPSLVQANALKVCTMQQFIPTTHCCLGGNQFRILLSPPFKLYIPLEMSWDGALAIVVLVSNRIESKIRIVST
jgi:hypothetical protein